MDMRQTEGKFSYKDTAWEKLRLLVLRRDNYTCEFCGQLCTGKNRNGFSPVVDHIKTVRERPDLAGDPDNLRVLCKSCDNKRHSEKGKVADVPQVCDDGFPKDSNWR